MGWLLVATGAVAFSLAAFLTWATWDYTAWSFGSLSPTAAVAAALGAISMVAGLVLLDGRPRFLGLAIGALGVVAVALAADLFARDAGSSLLGDVGGWQGSNAGGASSLSPAWALLVQGVLLAAAGRTITE